VIVSKNMEVSLKSQVCSLTVFEMGLLTYSKALLTQTRKSQRVVRLVSDCCTKYPCIGQCCKLEDSDPAITLVVDDGTR